MRFITSICALCTLLLAAPIHSSDIEDLIGSLLIVSFRGSDLQPQTASKLSQIKPSGIIYYEWANGLENASQVRNLSCELQNLALQNRFGPLWIMVDQEGGRVCRLKRGEYSHFPSPMALGIVRNKALLEQAAQAVAQELAYSGINFNLAPTVDVYSNTNDTFIGNRCFSSLAQEVAECAKVWILGMQSHKIHSCIKHFPGLGRAKLDTHHQVVSSSASKQEFEAVDLFPFGFLRNYTSAIMTGHLHVPALDSSNIATFSPKILQGILREQMGYNGLIFCDSLMMAGSITNMQSLEDNCIRAIEAGCDALIVGGRALVGENVNEINLEQVLKLKEKLVARIQKDDKLYARVLEASERINRSKASLNILPTEKPDWFRHSQIALQIARSAVRWYIFAPKPFSATSTQVALVVPESTRAFLKELMPVHNIKWQLYDWDEFNPVLHSSVHVIACTHEAWQNPVQKDKINQAIKLGRQVALVTTGTPRDSQEWAQLPTLMAYSNDPYTFAAVIEQLLAPRRLNSKL